MNGRVSYIYYFIPLKGVVLLVRKKINITIDEALLAELREEMKKRNLSLSRLIENKLKGIN